MLIPALQQSQLPVQMMTGPSWKAWTKTTSVACSRRQMGISFLPVFNLLGASDLITYVERMETLMTKA